MNASQPIGIFDSGIGGLTVAKAIANFLPNESLIYFGDTAHFPYGDKSPQAIRRYSVRIAEFLVSKGAKIIVIACNSASSVAYETLKRKYSHKLDVISVVEPVVQYVARQPYKKVGIIGTKATIGSQVHAERLHVLNPKLKVVTMATPLLAPMIEEGFFNNNISQTIINSYLSNWRFKGVQAMVLACTHYPLIKKEMNKFYQSKVALIDTTEIVAAAVKASLEQQGLLSPRKRGIDRFYVSDYTASFEKTTQIFYQQQIRLQHYPLWKKGEQVHG